MEPISTTAHLVRCQHDELSAPPSSVGIGKAIVEAASNLERATSAEGVWTALKSFSAQHGFEYMLVMTRREKLAHGAASTVLYNDMPQGVVERFDLSAHSDDNPFALRAVTDVRPFSASESWTNYLNESQKRALAVLCASLGGLDGFMVPIRNVAEVEGVVLFGGPSPDMSPIRRSALHVLSHCAFERAAALAASPKRKDAGLLSPRETECLRWAAAGKTDNEIGMILTISPRTARFHIENAKKKFGVSTRIQAVTEALRLKAIAA